MLRLLSELEPVELELTMTCAQLADRQSVGNVVAELTGREFPDEIVLLGAHLDSWHAGQGAHDNAQGCVAIWEALRLLKTLGLTPKRTIRIVWFVDEEISQAGGRAYTERHRDELAKHVCAVRRPGTSNCVGRVEGEDMSNIKDFHKLWQTRK